MSNLSVKLRCAVYTRKSTEEGLDQEFNSLDAQREACVAYIASQVGLGWKLIPDHYDDGGISGGTMERPALQRLLQDIRDKRVDVVVVYKIDRLTRSLTDFSKIVEVFDASNVSFVSVTQQFNTTTSMGRLTLNVLLSFAQFEREVTAERIRDKIAASKRKGMWMGGVVPLGYRVEARKLIVDEIEAETVRHLFNRYLDLKSVRELAEEAEATGLRGKPTSGSRASVARKPFGRGNLYHLLSNPLYIGKIRHGAQIYEGEHLPVIDRDTFAQAQKLLAEQAPRRSLPSNRKDRHLLTGIVFDETGDRLSPSHVKKDGKPYRYYVSNRLMQARKKGSDGWRIPAPQLESLVERQLTNVLSDRAQLAEWVREAGLGHEIEAKLALIASKVAMSLPRLGSGATSFESSYSVSS
jgi:site-specific DNA recombinase